MTLYNKEGVGSCFFPPNPDLGILTQALLDAGVFRKRNAKVLQQKGFYKSRHVERSCLKRVLVTFKSSNTNYDYYYNCIHEESKEKSPNYMFLSLFDIWANNAKWNGAVLMSSVLTTGKGDLVTLGEVYADPSVLVNLELYAIQFPKPQKEVYYHIGYCMITKDLV